MVRRVGMAAGIAVAAVAAPIWCAPTEAQIRANEALPGWKISEICARESAPGQCIVSEASARGVVSASWSFVLDPIKETCLAQAQSPSDHSWRLLAECLDAEAVKAVDKAAVLTAKTPAELPASPPVSPPAVEPPAAPAATSAESPPAAPSPSLPVEGARTPEPARQP